MHELAAIRTLPLGLHDALGEGLTIRMRQWPAIMSVQVERGALTAMESAAIRGVRWPCYPNTTAGRDPFIWWMGPERWLVTSGGLGISELMGELTAITEGHLATVVDLSDSMTTIQLVGEAARRLLARGTCLGLDDRVLENGRCARTRVANLAVLLRPLEESGCGYEVLVDRSEAQFLVEWLRDCAIGLESPRPPAIAAEPVDGRIAVNAADRLVAQPLFRRYNQIEDSEPFP